MDITVTFQDGVWVTDPDPAIVLVDTKVRWIIRAPRLSIPSLRWSIKFSERVFKGESTLVVKTRDRNLGTGGADFILEQNIPFLEEIGLLEEALLDHRGVSAPIVADTPGEYKYDLMVENADTGESVGDEDPFLIVLPHPFWI